MTKTRFKPKRALAWLLTLCMVFTMLPMSVLANEGGELNLVGGDVCVCDSLCDEENVNADCTVCADNYLDCAYVNTLANEGGEELPPADGEELPPTDGDSLLLVEGDEGESCICTEFCSDPDCPVCKDDPTQCFYYYCVCESVCEEDSVNHDCPTCDTDYASCVQAVEAPELNALSAETFGLEYKQVVGNWKLYQAGTSTPYIGEGTTWSVSGTTLTLLEGFNFNTTAATALVMPGHSTLQVNGNSIITNSNADGSQTIVGIDATGGSGNNGFIINVAEGKTLDVIVGNQASGTTYNYAIQSGYDFTKSGEGTLNATANNASTIHCIKALNKFTMSAGTLNATAGAGVTASRALSVEYNGTDAFTMTGGVLNATGALRAIAFTGSSATATLSGGTLKAIATGSLGAISTPGFTSITNPYWYKGAASESALSSASWTAVNPAMPFADGNTKALMFTFTDPTPANYTLYYNKTAGELRKGGMNGTVYEDKGTKWSGSGNTLTLKGIDFTTTADNALYLNDDTTIVIEDGTTNSLTSTDENSGIGIIASEGLTIQGGTGTLTATGTFCGVRVDNYSGASNFTMEGGTLIAIGEPTLSGYGINLPSADFVMTGGTINASGGSSAARANGATPSAIVMGKSSDGDYSVPAEFAGGYVKAKTGGAMVTDAKITVPNNYTLYYGWNSSNVWGLYKDSNFTIPYPADATWSLDSNNNLVLNGFDFTTTADVALKMPAEDKSIVLADSSTNSIQTSHSTGTGIYSIAPTTITGGPLGTGILNVQGAKGINISYDLAINGGTINVTGTSTDSSDYCLYAINFAMSGGNLTVTSANHTAIRINGDFTSMTGGTITSTGTTSAMYIGDGNVPSDLSIKGKGSSEYDQPAAFGVQNAGYDTKIIKLGADGSGDTVADARITVPITYSLYFKKADGLLYKEEAFTNAVTVDGASGELVNQGIPGVYKLVLNGVNFTTTAAKALVMPADTTINVTGNSTIASEHTGTTSPTVAIHGDGALTINVSQGATLTATTANATGNPSSKYGISYTTGDLTKTGAGELIATAGNASGSNSSNGINATSGGFVMNGGTVTATGGTSGNNSCGIYAYGPMGTEAISITSGTVNATGGTATSSSAGILAGASAKLNISGGTVTSTGAKHGVYVVTGAFDITGGSLIANGATNAMSAMGTTPDPADIIVLGASTLDGTYDIPAEFDGTPAKTIKATSGGAAINYAKIKPNITYTLHFNTTDGKLYKAYNSSKGEYGQPVTVSGMEGYQHVTLGWILLLDGADFSTTAASALVLPSATFISVLSDSTIASTNTDSSIGTTYGIEGKDALEISVSTDKTLTVTTGNATAASNATRYGIKTAKGFTASGGGTIIATAGNAAGSGYNNQSYGIMSGTNNADWFAVNGGTTVQATGGNVASSSLDNGSYSYGIRTTNFKTETGGKVIATGGTGNENSGSYGIQTTHDNGFLILSGAVTATSGAGRDSRAVYVSDGDFSIGAGTVTATANAASDSSYGIIVTDSSKEFNMTGGRIFAKGKTPLSTSASLSSGTDLFVRGMGTTNYTVGATFANGGISPNTITDARITTAVTRSAALDFTAPAIASYVDVNGNTITNESTTDDILDSGEGWEWYVDADGSDPRLNNATGKVLLLDGLQLNTTDGLAVKVPADTTIVVISDSYTGCPASTYPQTIAFWGEGNLTIDVNEGVSLTVESGTAQGVLSYGIMNMGDFKKKGKGTLSSTITNASEVGLGFFVMGNFTMDAGKIIAITNASAPTNEAMLVMGTTPASGIDIKGYGGSSYSVEALFADVEAVPDSFPAHKTIKADDAVVTNAQLTISSSPDPTPTPVPSDGGSSEPYIPAPKNSITVTANGAASYTATVNDNKLVASVPSQSLNNSIDKLLNELKINPDKQQVIEIKVSGAPDAVNTSEFSLPRTALVNIVDKTDAALSIDAGGLGKLTFDNAALESITNAGSDNVKIVIDDITRQPESKLTDEQKAVIGSNPVYDFGVFIGTKRVSEFGLGTVTVSLPYTPKANENPNSIIIYYVDGNGKLQMIPNGKYDAKTDTVTFSTNHFSLYMISYNAKTFTDIGSHWAKNAIELSASRNLVNGVGNDRYEPDREITRAEFVQMMQNVLKLPSAANVSANYADVDSTMWSYPAIMSAKRAGILNGLLIDGNDFKPNQPITREEMAVILANIAIYKKANAKGTAFDINKFNDADLMESNYLEKIELTIRLGLMSKDGVGGGKFSPKGLTTRAQAAQVQMNLLDVLK